MSNILFFCYSMYMNRSYFLFNTICATLVAFFLFATALLWHQTVAPSLSRLDIPQAAPIEIHFSNNNEVTLPSPNDANAVVSDVEENSSPSSTTADQIAAITSLPAEINLPVPFTSQAPEANWEQPWQDACEEAAVLMLDAYYKGYGLSVLTAKDEILKMVAWEDSKGWNYSIPIVDVNELAMDYIAPKDYSFHVIENPSVDDIKQFLANGHPVLVVAYGKDLPNPFFSGDGPEYHALVIRGYTDSQFITNDPGTKRGENFLYNYQDLMSAIHDWNGGDVQNGKAVIMVAK